NSDAPDMRRSQKIINSYRPLSSLAFAVKARHQADSMSTRLSSYEPRIKTESRMIDYLKIRLILDVFFA
ncbi:MAG TPA: hypothetical protein VMT24_01935, partial [Aggregatilineaceae bacterium]|nr:hypothetical protein [Aggregatilineaceae bacterium]